MISNIIKYIGVICAALVIGYIVGIRQGSKPGGDSTSSSISANNEVEKSTTTTTEVIKPDGSRTIKTVTDTTKVSDKKESSKVTVTPKERPRQFRTTVAVRPEWKKELKGHPVVAVGKRLWDSPAWADVIVDVDRKEVAVGISLEW
jgi:hypothetical protein